MNGQVRCHNLEMGIMGLPMDPAQLLTFGSIRMDLAGLSCKGCCTSVLTRLTLDGQAEDGDIQCCRFPCVPSSNEDVSRSGVVKVSSEAMAFLHTNAQVARQQRSMNSFHKPKPVEGTIDSQEEE